MKALSAGAQQDMADWLTFPEMCEWLDNFNGQLATTAPIRALARDIRNLQKRLERLENDRQITL